MYTDALNRRKTFAAAGTFLIILSFLCSLLTTTGFGGFPNLPGSGSTVPLSAAVSTSEKTGPAANKIANGIKGIDVSEYQGKIDWTKVAKTDVEFAFIRASYGQKTDKYFKTNAEQANANGIKVGYYHYAKFYSREEMIKEADYYIKLLDQVPVTYPVALDLEGDRKMSKAALTELALEFMDRVSAKGYTVLFYTYTNFFPQYLVKKDFDNSKYELWIANRAKEPSDGQVIWQYGEKGKVDGISGPVDLNVAYRDLSTSKKITVNKEISTSIKETLNERHGSGLPIDGLDMAQMKSAVVTALQSELNRQLSAGVPVTGVMDQTTLDALDQVPFTYGETKGNITYLLQVMLFYKGHYTQALTGQYDEHMYSALEKFQRDKQLSITGEPDRNTCWELLR